MPKKGFASGTRPSSKTRSLLRRCALNGQCAPAPIARVRPSHSVTSLGENGQPTERASKRSACAPAAEVQPPPTCRRAQATMRMPPCPPTSRGWRSSSRRCARYWPCPRSVTRTSSTRSTLSSATRGRACSRRMVQRHLLRRRRRRRSRSRRTTASSTLRYVGRHRVVHTPLILAHALAGLPDRRLSLPRTPRREHGHVSSLTRTSSSRSSFPDPGAHPARSDSVHTCSGPAAPRTPAGRPGACGVAPRYGGSWILPSSLVAPRTILVAPRYFSKLR